MNLFSNYMWIWKFIEKFLLKNFVLGLQQAQIHLTHLPWQS